MMNISQISDSAFMRCKWLIFGAFLLVFVSCREQNLNHQIVKEEVALTPPMGWNSYNCFGAAVIENEVRANAEFMAKNLIIWDSLHCPIRGRIICTVPITQ